MNYLLLTVLTLIGVGCFLTGFGLHYSVLEAQTTGVLLLSAVFLSSILYLSQTD